MARQIDGSGQEGTQISISSSQTVKCRQSLPELVNIDLEGRYVWGSKSVRPIGQAFPPTSAALPGLKFPGQATELPTFPQKEREV